MFESDRTNGRTAVVADRELAAVLAEPAIEDRIVSLAVEANDQAIVHFGGNGQPARAVAELSVALRDVLAEWLDQERDRRRGE